jgi:hypothetical protein
VEPESNNHEFQNDEKTRVTLEAWRDSAHAHADRPEWFWARQRARISSAVAEQSGSRAPKLAWAGLAATVAAAVLLFLPAHQEKPRVEQVVESRVEISDHDLMLALQRTMDGDVPSSLAPAGVLANEMNQAYEVKSYTQKSKEKDYEE